MPEEIKITTTVANLPRGKNIKYGVKECPWCPDATRPYWKLYYAIASDGSISVSCHNCGCIGPAGVNKGEARKQWNNRK